MIKEIKYNGFSASPGDHEALEGDLCVAMNLIPEHNTIRPVLPPKVIAQIPGDTNLPIDKGRKIVCIHQTSAFKHFIVAIEFDGLSPQHPPYTYLYRWDGTEGSGLVRLGYKAFNEVYKVEPVGNTLVVLTDTGIHYYLWRNGSYRYLGTHIPELDLRISAVSSLWDVRSDGYKVAVDSGTTADSINYASDATLRHELKQAVMAAANNVISKVFKMKSLAFPVFVRYALRLYDDSIINHSAPILVIPTMEAPIVDMGWTVTEGANPTVQTDADVTALFAQWFPVYQVMNAVSAIERFEDWKDIVTGVNFYFSPQFYTYDQAISDDKINLFGSKVLPDRDIENDVKNNGNFFLIESVNIDNILTNRSPVPGSELYSDVIHIDFEPSNDNIVVRERMTDDYGTHDDMMADRSFAYNNRINLAGVKKKLFNGFNPECMWYRIGDNNTASTTHTVVIETDGREIVVQSPAGLVNYDATNTVIWYYYPNANAKRVYVDIGGTCYMLRLTAHPTLNGAYFYGLSGDASVETVSTIPTPSTDDERIVDMPNKVYTSEVNNPFYFPSTGINSIGTGNVLGICAAVRPVSTSQFGYADLYIFADSGIWTAKINDKGTYSDVTLATGDICINPDSITQMETSVLFTTDRGIMLISGSKAQCISEAIDDDGQPFTLQHPAVDDMATMLGLDVGISPFKDFVRECRMVYDYTGQRIIVYNPGYNYAYIYSLESNKWGMMQCNIDYSIRAYPAALAVTRDGELVNCSVGDGTAAVTQMLITRPLSLDLPDVQKTVRAVMQRGLFRKHQGHVRSILFASRDMLDWFSMMSSKDEDMRGFSGTGFKWFRIGLLLQLEPHESIQGCSIQYDTKYTNRLR